jgi:hypothetical protein
MRQFDAKNVGARAVTQFPARDESTAAAAEIYTRPVAQISPRLDPGKSVQNASHASGFSLALRRPAAELIAATRHSARVRAAGLMGQLFLSDTKALRALEPRLNLACGNQPTYARALHWRQCA